MSSYKRLPFSKDFMGHTDPLWVRGVSWIQQRWKSLLPFLIVAVVGLSLFLGLRFYSDSYEARAASLLDLKGPSDSNEVIQKYPRSDAAVIAKLTLAQAALKEKKWDEAIALYEPLQKLPQRLVMFQIAASQNLALAYSKKGEFEKALSLLEATAADPENQIQDYTKLLQAEVYLEKGDKEKAQKIYAELAEGSSLFEVRQAAKKRSEWPKK